MSLDTASPYAVDAASSRWHAVAATRATVASGAIEGCPLRHRREPGFYTASTPSTRRVPRRSMAAYSLVSHLLGLKDRHNGNILLDNKGHVIHIDFGFLLGTAPGGSFSLERVPFKLTAEHVEAMGGWQSDGFADFVVLLCCGFSALQKHSSKILALVEVMARDSPFPCFKTGTAAVEKMRSRLKLHLTTNEQVAAHVADLVRQSYNAYGTRQYDSFQYLTNGIYS